MNLSNLFIKQAELDAYTIKKKGLEGQDLLPNTILALLVELGECAGEWRGFKHWSEDKEPRTEKLLVEYVDCLHFILSIGNSIKYDFEEARYLHKDNVERYTSTDIVDHFNQVFRTIINFSDEADSLEEYFESYEDIALYFLSLGEMLGFSWEEIEQAYITKWNINKERQENGY